MILRALALVVASTLPALAQDDGSVDAFRGTYGSATDPATSCAANPHALDFIANPPHATFTWAKPWTDKDGASVGFRRYDLLALQGTTLILRLEGDPTRTDTGDHPIWILRLTSNPQGYCWGRTDWPSVRCEDEQLRCDSATS